MKKLLLLFSILGICKIAFNQAALNFDGLNDYVQTTYKGVLGSQNRTFEAWIYLDTPASISNQAILDFGSNVAGGRNTFCVKSDRSLAYISGISSGNLSSGSSVIPLVQWTHVAFVLNSGTGYLYVNGIEVATGFLSGVSTGFSGDRVRIGERVSGGSILFKGSIDEVRIWESARDSIDIANNQNAEFCSPQYSLYGLYVYYRFNEGIPGGSNTLDTIAIDHSSIFDAKLKGFALTGTSSNYVAGPPLTPGYSRSFVIDSACNNYITSSGKIFNTTGFHFDTLRNSVFCDSLIEYNITINTVDDSVYKVGNKLVSNDTWAQHQWVDCNKGFALISGETNYDFLLSSPGKYAVIVSRGVCTDTSDCFKYGNVSNTQKGKLETISLYPNPVTDMITLNSDYSLLGSKAVIYTISGKLIKHITISSANINVSDFASGIYYLQLKTELGSHNLKFVKN